mmetsp:Transcript_38025/g.119363  ORF Transcript_38025/g.119363 Transcript_38025/m.119363 type:complete len:217 (-) Transcript_38025:14-664(-)
MGAFYVTLGVSQLIKLRVLRSGPITISQFPFFFVPYTLCYNVDLAYGNKIERLNREVHEILQNEKHWFNEPMQLPPYLEPAYKLLQEEVYLFLTLTLTLSLNLSLTLTLTLGEREAARGGAAERARLGVLHTAQGQRRGARSELPRDEDPAGGPAGDRVGSCGFYPVDQYKCRVRNQTPGRVAAPRNAARGVGAVRVAARRRRRRQVNATVRMTTY